MLVWGLVLFFVTSRVLYKTESTKKVKEALGDENEALSFPVSIEKT